MKAGLLRDLWTASSPDLRVPRQGHRRGSTSVFDRRGRLAAAGSRRVGGASRASTAARAPPATFRLIASPMVAWIWIGGLIVFAGGLIALWPAPDAAAPPRDGRLRGARGARPRPRVALVRWTSWRP